MMEREGLVRLFCPGRSLSSTEAVPSEQRMYACQPGALNGAEAQCQGPHIKRPHSPQEAENEWSPGNCLDSWRLFSADFSPKPWKSFGNDFIPTPALPWGRVSVLLLFVTHSPTLDLNLSGCYFAGLDDN